jgi:hypothetical protein
MRGEPDDNQEECGVCDSTGYICERCNAPDGNCECLEESGETNVPCPECK